MGNNNLTVGSLTGGSSSNYVVTDGTGSLTINNIGSSAKLFPVGPSTTQYAPVTISNSINRNFTVKVGNTVTSPVSGYRYVNHQWDITPSVLTGNTATLALGWSSSAQAATFNPAQAVQINHFNTTSNTWDASFSATVAGTNPYTATATGITVFSPFSTSNAPIVPVELLDFAAIPSLKGNLLTWQTASEINNKGYDIERSYDGTTFTTIGNVKGIGKAANYNFVDANPYNGINYYRLKQMDFDGKETLSKVVSVTTTGKGTSKIKIFPTHTEGSISIDNGGLTIDNIAVFNHVGQLVLTNKGVNRLDLSAMPSGLYLVQVKAGGEMVTEKVFKR